eukprot:9471480-Pyramimonas_sp.AAC.2
MPTPRLIQWRRRLKHPPKIEPPHTLWYPRPRLGASWWGPGTSLGILGRSEPSGAPDPTSEPPGSLLKPPGASWGILEPLGAS